jgi:hypothetical protein
MWQKLAATWIGSLGLPPAKKLTVHLYGGTILEFRKTFAVSA